MVSEPFQTLGVTKKVGLAAVLVPASGVGRIDVHAAYGIDHISLNPAAISLSPILKSSIWADPEELTTKRTKVTKNTFCSLHSLR
jgi:hypothetical protein